LPTVLTREDVAAVLGRLRGVHRVIGRLLYGTGTRIMECVRLRVKDVDFSRREILIRDGKGARDRVTMLPRAVQRSLRVQVAYAREQHALDLADGCGDRQAGDAAYTTSFVRDAFARIGLRHPDRAGASRACGCEHDDDLHARAEPRRTGSGESTRRPEFDRGGGGPVG
jgi:integrase